MKETQAIIERISRVNDTHQQLHLAVDASLLHMKAGQSLLARVSERWDPYLREQWWPVIITKHAVIVERLAAERYEPGQVVNLLGVIGQPYRFRRTLRNVLLIAYEAPPTPLLMTIPALLANRVSVTLLLLGNATRYGTQHLPPEVEILQGDSDLNWANRVTTVGWADQVFVTVKREGEINYFQRVWTTFQELRAEIPQSYLFGVFQPMLPCGIGACQACMVRMKGEPALTCSDGPALDLTQVRFTQGN
jgi:hypothetical protein